MRQLTREQNEFTRDFIPMDTASEAILGFCNAREHFALAGVSARWRNISHIARVTRAFRDALREDCTAPVLANLTHNLPLQGPLSASESSMSCIRGRLEVTFILAGMRDLARNIANDPAKIESRARAALCIACNVDELRDYNPDYVYDYCSAGSIIGMVSMLGLMPQEKIKRAADIIYPKGSYCSCADAIRIIAACTHPSAAMGDCLECVASGDIAGFYEYLPHLRGSRDDPQLNITIRTFTHEFMTRVRIGPVFARVLLGHYKSMHHIAAQFSRESPEFELYAKCLNSAISEKWNTGRETKKMREKTSANLVNAARNPDDRVFEYVYHALDDAGLIAQCTIMRWNCGDGFEVLRRMMTRLEQKMVCVCFDGYFFWYDFRIAALPMREAIQCVDLILARIGNLRGLLMGGTKSRAFLWRCAALFGEPMREMFATHGIRDIA